MSDTKRAVLIVDGAYLLTSGKNQGGAPLDYSSQNIENLVKLLEKSCGFSFSDAYWFDALITDNKTNKQLYEQKQLTSSLQLNQFKVIHKGVKTNYVRCPNPQCPNSKNQGIAKTVQAGVDVAIATKMMELVCEGMMDVLVLVAGDGDFLEALKYVAENRRKTVYLAGFDGSMSQVLQSYASRGCIIRLNDQWATLAYRKNTSPIPSPCPSFSDPPPPAPYLSASTADMALEPAVPPAAPPSSEPMRHGLVGVWLKPDDLIPPNALMAPSPSASSIVIMEGERRKAEEARAGARDEGLKGSQIRALLNRPNSNDPPSPPLSAKQTHSGDDALRLQWTGSEGTLDTDEAQRRLLGTLDLLLMGGSPSTQKKPALLPHPNTQRPPAASMHNDMRPANVNIPNGPASPRRLSDHNPPARLDPSSSQPRNMDDYRGQFGLQAGPVHSQPLPGRPQPDPARTANVNRDYFQRYPSDSHRGPAPSGGPSRPIQDRSLPDLARPDPTRVPEHNRDYQRYLLDPPNRGPAPSSGPPTSLPSRTLPGSTLMSLPYRHLPDRTLPDPTRMASTSRDYGNQRYPPDASRGLAPSGGPPSSSTRPHMGTGSQPHMGTPAPPPKKFFVAPPQAQQPPSAQPAVLKLPAPPASIPIMPLPQQAPRQQVAGPGVGVYLLQNRGTEQWQASARGRPRSELPPRLKYKGSDHAKPTVD